MNMDMNWPMDLVSIQVPHCTGLVKSANTSRLFLPKCKGGLQLPSISATFSRSVLQCAKAASLISSRETLIRHLATQKTLAELKGRPSSHTNRWSRQWWRILDLVARVKKWWCRRTLQLAWSTACWGLTVQGQTMRQFNDCAATQKSVYLCISPAQWGKGRGHHN